ASGRNSLARRWYAVATSSSVAAGPTPKTSKYDDIETAPLGPSETRAGRTSRSSSPGPVTPNAVEASRDTLLVPCCDAGHSPNGGERTLVPAIGAHSTTCVSSFNPRTVRRSAVSYPPCAAIDGALWTPPCLGRQLGH